VDDVVGLTPVSKPQPLNRTRFVSVPLMMKPAMVSPCPPWMEARVLILVRWWPVSLARVCREEANSSVLC